MIADPPDWQSLTAPERRAIFEPLWVSGKSAGEITFYFLNASRNAVIGAVSRAKLKRGKTRTAKPNPRKPRVPRVKPAMAIKSDKNTNQERVIALDMDPPGTRSRYIDENRPPLAGTVPIGIMDLPGRSGVLCRFPVVGGYCGQASGDHTYCETHRRYAYKAREVDE